MDLEIYIYIMLTAYYLTSLFKVFQRQLISSLLYSQNGSNIRPYLLHRAFDWPLLAFISSTQIPGYCGSSFNSQCVLAQTSAKENEAVKHPICWLWKL